MHNRIKELVKQAGGIGYDDDNNELTPVLVGRGLEKFAELIVEECAQICWTVSEIESKGYAVSECAKRIRKNFGVEV
jgi:hypothetical protein